LPATNSMAGKTVVRNCFLSEGHLNNVLKLSLNHHHHLPPWIRSFDLFRHRRVAIVSWSVRDPFFPGVFRWGRISGVWYVHSFEVVDPVLFVFESHILYSRDLYAIQMTRLEAAEMRFLRSVTRYTRLDKIRSEDIRQELEISGIKDLVLIGKKHNVSSTKNSL